GPCRGEGGGSQAAAEHQVPVAPLHLPERGLEVERELVTAPGVIDEHVEAALLAADPLESASTWESSVWSQRTAMPVPPRALSSSAVSSIVPGRPRVVGSPRTERPVT